MTSENEYINICKIFQVEATASKTFSKVGINLVFEKGQEGPQRKIRLND